MNSVEGTRMVEDLADGTCPNNAVQGASSNDYAPYKDGTSCRYLNQHTNVDGDHCSQTTGHNSRQRICPCSNREITKLNGGCDNVGHKAGCVNKMDGRWAYDGQLC